MWKEKSWIFHQDSAPPHSALSVKRFLAKHSIPVLEHPPYSPDLAPWDFYLFPKVHEQMSRFGGLSEERPSVFKTPSKLGTHLSTQCSGDERQSGPCPAR
ncbi:putative mariner transposase [Trichonephila clavipes]|uniref:Putative mariner transposase n=1 Tax=Trichonephila clavipes TaxID=2585209 RepID=A0A8X6VJD8_TRICX|nr:putative mariner transposase [Trichonephila clavipes]